MTHFTPLGRWLEWILLFIISITIHEFAHAITADRLGDKTPRSQGRVSLNPIDHIDPVGLIAMAVSQLIGTGIGWGKPVFTNPMNFRHPRRDTMIVAFAGPFSNLLQAIVFALPLRYDWVLHGGNSERVLLDGLFLNCILLFFNMIPIGPLDGAKVLAGILHEKDAETFELFMRRFGIILFVLLITTHATRYIVMPPAAGLLTKLAPDYYVEQR